jgi:hypothetical protein
MYFLQSNLSHGRVGRGAEFIYYKSKDVYGTTITKNSWVPYAQLIDVVNRIHVGKGLPLRNFLLEIIYA